MREFGPRPTLGELYRVRRDYSVECGRYFFLEARHRILEGIGIQAFHVNPIKISLKRHIIYCSDKRLTLFPG